MGMIIIPVLFLPLLLSLYTILTVINLYKNKKIDSYILKNAFILSLSIIIFTIFTSDTNYYYGLIISLPLFSMIIPFCLYLILKITLFIKKIGKKDNITIDNSYMSNSFVEKSYIILCSISISIFLNIFIIFFQSSIFGPLHP